MAAEVTTLIILIKCIFNSSQRKRPGNLLALWGVTAFIGPQKQRDKAKLQQLDLFMGLFPHFIVIDQLLPEATLVHVISCRPNSVIICTSQRAHFELPG